MANEIIPPELTQEERLTAIAYQFINLYERWSEDRQIAAKQGADNAELVKLLTEQVKNFEAIESKVREFLVASINHSAVKAAKTVGDEVKKAATQSIDEINQRLLATAQRAEKAIADTQQEVKSTYWTGLIFWLLLPIITSLLIVWLFMPRPTLPLTTTQLNTLYGGQLMDRVWPKLSSNEKKHWLALAHEAENKPIIKKTDNSEAGGQADNNEEN